MTMRLFLLAAPLLLGTIVHGQVPTTSLSGGSTLPDAFSQVISVAELQDGRIVVSDFRERTLQIADFRAQTITQLGRIGGGPAEYQLVSMLHQVAGDTILMWDHPQSRLFIIAPDGSIAGTRTLALNFAAPLPDERPTGSRLMTAPQYIDRNGVLYSTVSYLVTGVGSSPDGAFVVAYDPGRQVQRRAAPLQTWYPERTTRWRAPFLYGDAIAVSRDGRVARVVPTDYHVEWYRDGQLSAKGPPVTVAPVRVTKADRDAWYAERAANMPSGGGRASMPEPARETPARSSSETRPSLRPFTDADFPVEKPPFLAQVGRPLVVSPTGDLWVNRAVGHGAQSEADIFDARGVLVQRVMMPPETRVVAIGRASVYVVRKDADGLEWIERYPLPSR